MSWPPGRPLSDDPDELLGEAFTPACYNGRLEAAAWLLDHGAHVDMRPYLDMTALHFAVVADRTIRDGVHGRAALA